MPQQQTQHWGILTEAATADPAPVMTMRSATKNTSDMMPNIKLKLSSWYCPLSTTPYINNTICKTWGWSYHHDTALYPPLHISITLSVKHEAEVIIMILSSIHQTTPYINNTIWKLGHEISGRGYRNGPVCVCVSVCLGLWTLCCTPPHG